MPTDQTSPPVSSENMSGLQWDEERDEPYIVVRPNVRITPLRMEDADAMVRSDLTSSSHNRTTLMWLFLDKTEIENSPEARALNPDSTTP